MSDSKLRTSIFVAFLILLGVATYLLDRHAPTFIKEYHWYVVAIVFLLTMGLRYLLDRIGIK